MNALCEMVKCCSETETASTGARPAAFKPTAKAPRTGQGQRLSDAEGTYAISNPLFTDGGHLTMRMKPFVHCL